MRARRQEFANTREQPSTVFLQRIVQQENQKFYIYYIHHRSHKMNKTRQQDHRDSSLSKKTVAPAANVAIPAAASKGLRPSSVCVGCGQRGAIVNDSSSTHFFLLSAISIAGDIGWSIVHVRQYIVVEGQ